MVAPATKKKPLGRPSKDDPFLVLSIHEFGTRTPTPASMLITTTILFSLSCCNFGN